MLVDVSVPLVPPRVARVQLPPEGSAGMIAQTLLGEEVQVVSALQNVAAAHLQASASPNLRWASCAELSRIIRSREMARGMAGLAGATCDNLRSGFLTEFWQWTVIVLQITR